MATPFDWRFTRDDLARAHPKVRGRAFRLASCGLTSYVAKFMNRTTKHAAGVTRNNARGSRGRLPASLEFIRMQALNAYLQTISPGSIADPSNLESLLAACWERFQGGSAEGMAGAKLHGRIEEVRWEPPLLSFVIHRHGGTVMGSSRAERHRWELNLDLGTAGCSKVGYRQLRSSAAPLDVRPLAQSTADAILGHRENQSLQWTDDGSVRVRVGSILPPGSAAAQTLADRRRRFWHALDESLRASGWQRVSVGDIGRPPPAACDGDPCRCPACERAGIDSGLDEMIATTWRGVAAWRTGTWRR